MECDVPEFVVRLPLRQIIAVNCEGFDTHGLLTDDEKALASCRPHCGKTLANPLQTPT